MTGADVRYFRPASIGNGKQVVAYALGSIRARWSARRSNVVQRGEGRSKGAHAKPLSNE